MTDAETGEFRLPFHVQRYFRRVPLAAAATVTTCVAVASLLGASNFAPEARIPRQLVGLDPFTGGGFIVCAALLLLTRITPSARGVAPIRWTLEVALLLLGICGICALPAPAGPTCPQAVATWLGILSERVANPMASGTAIAFLCLALAFLADHRQTGNGRAVSRSLATLAFLVALTAVLGHAYGAPRLYLGLDGEVPMSLLTAMLVIVVAGGVVWLRSEYGFPAMLAEDSVVGTHVRAVLPMVVGAPLLVGVAVAAGYGQFYAGEFAIALTSLGSVAASSLVAIASIVVLRKADSALYVRDRALQAATTGVIITDHRAPDEPVVYTNKAFTQLSGFGPGDIHGRNCRVLNTGIENDPQTLEAIRRCIDNGEDGTFELQNRRKDGTTFWNRLSLAPVYNYENVITHFVGIMDDITWRHDQQEQLQKALQEARAAGEMRDTLVRLVSHELRAPLNAALTWVRLMELDRQADTLDKGLAVVAQSIESQSRLIGDLVDANRFERRGVRLESATADARELVEQTVEEMRPTVGPTKTLVLQIRSGDYVGWLDPLRVRQIVRNLLSNANKYTPDGGTITVA
ncbi:MAG: PAS domain-containing protein [Pseudomonadota bacterium]|nr:PAS domain-containing protein [Pseudomonadota bacterium]